MEIKVHLNNLRIAPRKVRQVVDLIRGKTAVEAKTTLEFTIKRAVKPVLKLLNSALASAKHDFQIDESNLYVSKILVDEGPKLKRWQAMSRGRAYPIEKRTSHITLVLSEIKPKKKIKNDKKKTISTQKLENIVTKKEEREEPLKEKGEPLKRKFRPERMEIKKPKKEFSFKRIFQRKAI